MKRLRCLAAVVVAWSVWTALAEGHEPPRVGSRLAPASYVHRGTLHRGSASCDCHTCAAPRVYEMPCDGGCTASCVTCAPACNLIPNLVAGLDCLVQRLYLNPCNLPCPRPRCAPRGCMDAWFGYRNDCGCGTCGVEAWHHETSVPPPPVPHVKPPQPQPQPEVTNPFKDDALQAPPMAPPELGTKKKTPVKLQPVNTRKPKYSSEPSVLVVPVTVADITESSDEPAEPAAIVPAPSARPIRQVGHELPAMKSIPKNPLRDE